MSLLPASSSCCDPCASTSTTTVNLVDLIDDAVASRLPVISVATYGATGNGVNDDTAAIQAAIDYAGTYVDGAVVYFPTGLYRVSTSLYIGNSYVQLLGPNTIGGAVIANNQGATLLGTASGMGSVVYIHRNILNTAIYGVTIRNLRIMCLPGLASPPAGLYYLDATELLLIDCFIGQNLSIGLKVDGCAQFVVERALISGNAIGIQQTVQNAIVFNGQCNLQVNNSSVFDASTAGVVIDRYIDWCIYRNTFIEFTPIGFLLQPGTGNDMVVESFILDNVQFFNGVSTPYPNSRFIKVMANADANQSAIRSMTLQNCKSFCFGSTYAIEILVNGNTSPATGFTKLDFYSCTFYGVSTAAVYADSGNTSGRVIGSMQILAGYQTGAVKPFDAGAGIWSVDVGAVSLTAEYIPKASGASSLVNSELLMSAGDTILSTGNFRVLIGNLESTKDNGGLVLSTTDNNNESLISIRNGGSERTRISVATAAANLVIRNSSVGGRNAGFSFFNDALSAVVPILQLLNTGLVGIGTATPTSPLQVVGLPSYANNAAALAGGLTAGALYQVTATDPRQVAVTF